MKHNFFAGPAILPREVIEQSAEGLLNLNQSGLSIMEISHRSDPFVQILDEAKELVKELLGLGDAYEVLFLSGGASSQFFMTAMNLLSAQEKAAYIDTGSWSSKAIKEARRYGKIDVIASSKDRNYSYIPKNYKVPEDAKFLHVTSNNTIFGTQFHEWPNTEVKMVCDMSSDIFSRPLDANKFGIIYAGAQKNMGPSGTTLVILNKGFYTETRSDIPTMLNYQTHISKDSMFNTPPVFPIYVSMLTLKWIKAKGGLEAIQVINREKANSLYTEIDRNSLFKGTVDKKDRSLMNVCFKLVTAALENSFLNMSSKRDIVGIKGHRSVGGFRASIYNAMPKSSVDHLIQVMQDFEYKYG